MKPIGLTMKKGRNKYRLESRGELMLIHECMECSAISINRIAADDDVETVMAVFQGSLTVHHQIKIMCNPYGILPLNTGEMEMVRAQLYGQSLDISSALW